MRWLLLLALALIASPSHAEVVVFRGARLIDGTGKAPRQNAVLVVDGERIVSVGTAGKVSIPAGARVVEVKGRTIIPGLINAHGHAGLVVEGQNRADAYTRENVQAQLVRYEQYGVTSVLTLGLNRDLVFELRDEQRASPRPGANPLHRGPRHRRSGRGAAGARRCRPGVPAEDRGGGGGGRARDRRAPSRLPEALGRRHLRQVPEDGPGRVQGRHRRSAPEQDPGRLARLLPGRCEGADQ